MAGYISVDALYGGFSRKGINAAAFASRTRWEEKDQFVGFHNVERASKKKSWSKTHSVDIDLTTSRELAGEPETRNSLAAADAPTYISVMNTPKKQPRAKMKAPKEKKNAVQVSTNDNSQRLNRRHDGKPQPRRSLFPSTGRAN
jgi:hypothetical protein